MPRPPPPPDSTRAVGIPQNTGPRAKEDRTPTVRGSRPSLPSEALPGERASANPTRATIPPSSRSPEPHRAAAEDHDPLVGRLIAGKYRVTAQIAKGGMGRIYRAEQEPLGRLVAIKVVNAKFAADDPEYERRFFLEASVLSQLTHSNTVTVFDYGKTEDEIYYMAMELLVGRTVHRTLRTEGPFPPRRAINIVRQVARSVREAHDHGIVHRDLKPANVFLVENADEVDFVKVLDFGLAKHVEENADEQLTQTGLFMGSPKYMAPEQVDGRKLDGRADIYSLGVLFFEVLTGRVPFERATSVQTLMAHVTDPVPALASKAPEGVPAFPPALEAFVARCLEKTPEARFSSMDTLLAALKEVEDTLDDGLVAPRPTSEFPPRNAPSEKPDAPSTASQGTVEGRAAAPNRGRRIAGALVAMGLFAAIGVVGWKARPPKATPPRTTITAPPKPPVVVTTPEPLERPTTVDVLITTTPPGATVRDEAGELCAKTPCTIALLPEELDQTRLFTAVKEGYSKETKKGTLRDGFRATLLPATVNAPLRPTASAKGASVPDGFKGAY